MQDMNKNTLVLIINFITILFIKYQHKYLKIYKISLQSL
jgi:hypothetical protein